MNLPMRHCTEIRSGRIRRLAELGLFGGCALLLATAGCTRPESKSASDTQTVAATPAEATTPPAPSTTAPANTATVTSESTGETTSTVRPRPSEHARTESTHPTKHAAAAVSKRHADTATTAATTSTAGAATASPPQPAQRADTANAADSSTAAAGQAKTVAAATTEKADSTCSTENGKAGVQPAKPGSDPLLVNQSEYDGWKMFHVYCYRCHGFDAMGGGIAPNLRHSVGPDGSVDHACFIKTVTEGRLAKGMPSWKALLDPGQIENIWHYLQARSSGRLAPGRPHTASKG